MTVLSARHLSVSFSGTDILRDATFSVNEGDRVAIVGANGAGKTTLLRLLSGELTPDSGDVFVAAKKKIGVLDQHALEGSTKSVFQEALGAHRALIETEETLERLAERVRAGDTAAADRLAALSVEFERAGGLTYVSRTKSALSAVGLGAHADASVASLSGGQRTTLALVKLLLAPPDILLLDEPTNHLDLSALAWLEETVLSLKSTVLCVSHDRYFLDRVFFRTVEILGGKTEVYDLPFSRYREERKKRREVEQKHYDLQQKEIRRQEEIIRTYKEFNREKSIRAAESRQKALDKIERLDRPVREAQSARFSFSCAPSPHDVLRAYNLSFAYTDTPVVRDFSAEVFRGERIFLVGDIGCGKSTLLKLLCRRLVPDRGEILYGPGLKIGYYDQQNQNLNLSGTVFDELWQENDEQSEGDVRSYLAAFGFTGERAFQRVDTLSGGERCRLALSKLMRREFNLLFLDEPTNHLDMDSKEALEEALSVYPGTCVIVSHDRYFVRRLATKVYFLSRENAPQLIPDPARLDEFYRSFLKADAEKEKGESQAKEDYLRRKQKGADERRRRAALRNTESAVSEAEAALAALDEDIASHANDYQKLQELFRLREETEQKLEALYETLFSLQDD